MNQSTDNSAGDAPAVSSDLESRRIVWRLRLLATTGLLTVVATLTIVGVALWKVRNERAVVATEQRRLIEASDQLRRFAAQSHSEIQAKLDGTQAQPDAGKAPLNLQQSVRSTLNSHPDPAIVSSLIDLDALACRLVVFAGQADKWRKEYEVVSGDIREQRTLKQVRGLIAQLRQTISAAREQHRINDRIAFNDKLAEFSRLVEVLAGEEQFEALAGLKAQGIEPLLDAMAHSLPGLSTTPNDPVIPPAAIDALRVAVFGQDSDGENLPQDYASIGGLYNLRRDALRLRRQREKAKTESALLFEEIDTANASFAQSALGRAVGLAEQMEKSLGDGWRRMLIFGGGCSVIFLWLAHVISRGIYAQVKALEQARAESEKGRQTTQKLMIEQQAAAAELGAVHKKLLETSRRAGMAEVATGVLHNVGNVLNSVNVSSSLVTDSLKKSRLGHLGKVVALLRQHEPDLGEYLVNDPSGKQIPGFLAQLAEFLAGEQAVCLKELAQLQKNIEHIKDIVSMQQAYAGSAGFKEPIDVRELVEDALRIHLAAISRHDISVVKEFADVPHVLADKHKVLQILVNLFSNAKHAMKDSPSKTLTIRIDSTETTVRATVQDTGYGIPPENLTRIFAHGFTTKSDGHGFGLHSGALAAKEIGGSLKAQSDGPGQGATFTLELPMMACGAMAA